MSRRSLTAGRAEARLRELARAFDTLVLGAPPALETLLGDVRDVIGAERILAYGLEQRGRAFEFTFLHGAGIPLGRVRALAAPLLARGSASWGGLDPLRPEPEQRDVVLAAEVLLRRFEHDELPPIVRDLYEPLGWIRDRHVRVIVCEGPAPLGWLGAFQTAPFRPEQLRALDALVPHVRRRLLAERELARGGESRAMLAAALDALGDAAYIIRPWGAVVYANALGRRQLDADRAAVEAELRASLALPGERSPYALTPISGAGESDCLLARRRPTRDPRPGAEAVAAAAARWGLTRRQQSVLELVVEGCSNFTTAARLGISERTVEVHVTALFDRAQVANRATLVARVLGGG